MTLCGEFTHILSDEVGQVGWVGASTHWQIWE